MGKTTIKNSMTWKLAGTAPGGTNITMPTDYKEIMLVATGYSTYYFTAIIPKSEISSSNMYPRFASYYNASSNAGGYWNLTNSTVKLENYVVNGGTSVVAQATCKLYYR